MVMFKYRYWFRGKKYYVIYVLYMTKVEYILFIHKHQC